MRIVGLGGVSILIGLLAAPVALVAEAPDKAAPFTAVRWEGDRPLVEVDGQWYGLESLDGISGQRIIEACKKAEPKRWQKRFGEDLVEILRGMGHRPGAEAALVLTKDGKTVQRKAAMTRENRQSVWQHNREQRAKPDGPVFPGVPGLTDAIGEAQAKAPRRAFGFESARIAFKYTGGLAGTETLYVAGHGDTVVLDSNKKIGRWEKKTSVCRGKDCTIVDHGEKRSWTQKIKPADLDLSVMHATDSSLKMVGLVRAGTADVAGKPCTLYEKKDGDKLWRSWRWQGIELKIEMKNWMGLSYVKEATEVKEGAAIPEALLKVPAGYSSR